MAQIAIGIWILQALIRRRVSWSKTWREILLGSLPFLLFDLYFFGTIIPHAATAKAKVYSFAYSDVLRTLSENFASLAGTCPGGIEALSSILLAVLFLLACQRFLKSNPAATGSVDVGLSALGAVIILAAYVLGRAPIFPWYVPLFWLPLAYTTLAAARKNNIMLAFTFLLCFPFFRPLAENLYGLASKRDCHYYFLPAARVRSYLSIGSKLYRQHPQTTLLASEVGALGFSFKGKVLDGVGLISPEVLPYHPLKVPEERENRAQGAIPARFIVDTKPGLIVSLDKLIAGFAKNPQASLYYWDHQSIVLPRDNPNRKSFQLWNNRSIEVLTRTDLFTAKF